MNERQLAAAFAARLGPGSLRRLRALRRKLWLRRAAAGGIVALAAALLALALVQLIARSWPLEAAPWVMAAVVVIITAAWLAWSWLQRPSLAGTARRADEELELRERLATALELVGATAVEPEPDETQLGALQLADTYFQRVWGPLRPTEAPKLPAEGRD